MRKEIGLRGIMLVTGAGNIVRGQELRSSGIAGDKADLVGRLATIQNTIALAEALRDRDVPVATFLADSMRLEDKSLGDDLQSYSLDSVREAYDRQRVVLVGGGTGEDNVTTDNAVMTYANIHRGAGEGENILVLKGTKFDGVYDKDPAKFANARRYDIISAQLMQKEYDKYPVVDESCLDQIATTGLALRVYRDGQHDLSTVLRGHGTSAASIGTLIVSGPEDLAQLAG